MSGGNQPESAACAKAAGDRSWPFAPSQTVSVDDRKVLQSGHHLRCCGNLVNEYECARPT